MDTLLSGWIWLVGLMGMNTNTITATPNPVVQGGTLKICYDFGPGETSATLELTWTFTDGTESAPISITVTPDADDPEGGTGCVTVTVPSNAAGGVIDDTTGDAIPEAIAVSPSP